MVTRLSAWSGARFTSLVLAGLANSSAGDTVAFDEEFSNFLRRPDFRSYVQCACGGDRARNIAPSYARSRAFAEDAQPLPPSRGQRLTPSALRCPEDRTRRKGVSGAGYMIGMIVGGG